MAAGARADRADRRMSSSRAPARRSRRPLYTTWFETFNGANPNIQIDYQANGSGGGIKAITEQTVDFGASDAAMKDEEIAALKPGTKMLHIPTALGAVVVIFNVPGVDRRSTSTPTTIAGIFLGTITKWNDPKIAALNPGVDAARHAPSSSSTAPTARARPTPSRPTSTPSAPTGTRTVGAGKEVNWPTGIGAQGNDGVAGGVKQTDGRGRLRRAQLRDHGELTSALVKNAAGKFVAGSHRRRHRRRRGRRGRLPGRLPPGADHQRRGRHDLPDRRPTPTSSSTVDQTDADKGTGHRRLLLTGPSPTARQPKATLGYAPLPAEVQQKAIDELHTVTTGGIADLALDPASSPPAQTDLAARGGVGLRVPSPGVIERRGADDTPDAAEDRR